MGLGVPGSLARLTLKEGGIGQSIIKYLGRAISRKLFLRDAVDATPASSTPASRASLRPAHVGERGRERPSQGGGVVAVLVLAVPMGIGGVIDLV